MAFSDVLNKKMASILDINDVMMEGRGGGGGVVMKRHNDVIFFKIVWRRPRSFQKSSVYCKRDSIQFRRAVGAL